MVGKEQEIMITGAQFSDDRKYRYSLWRIWDIQKPYVAAILLNPSTADEIQNDPTVTRMIRRAETMKFGGIYVLNIFALRSTDPRKLYTDPDPVGKHNDNVIIRHAKRAGMVICGWGQHGDLHDRGQKVLAMLRALNVKTYALSINQSGQPRHPLYISYAKEPMELV